MKKNFVLFFLLVILVIGKSFGQGTCADADTLKSFNTLQEYYMNSNEYWLTFKADSSFIVVYLQPISDTSASKISRLLLYSGSCDNLVLIDSINLLKYDSILMYPIQIGNTYKIKVIRDGTKNGNFNLYTSNYKMGTTILSCGPTCTSNGVIINPNGNFNTITYDLDTALIFMSIHPDNWWYQLVATYEYPPDAYTNVCNWVSWYYAEAQLKRETSGNNFLFLYSYGWGFGNGNGYGNFAYNRLTGPTVPNSIGLKTGGNYTLSLRYNINGAPVWYGEDSVKIFAIDNNAYITYANDPFFFDTLTYSSTNVGQLIACIPNNNINGWQNYNSSFTCNSSNFNTIFIAPYKNNTFYGDQQIYPIWIDDIFVKTKLSQSTNYPNSICLGDSFKLQVKIPDKIVNWSWSSNQTSTTFNITNSNLNNNYPSTSTITGIATVTTRFIVVAIDSNGCHYTDTIILTVNKPAKPTISGYRNNCLNQDVAYNIVNPIPGASYHFYTDPTNYINIDTTTTPYFAIIKWKTAPDTIPNPTVIYATVSDSNGCTNIDSIYIYNCCNNENITNFFNVNITPSNIINSTPFAINDTVRFIGAFTLNNNSILMGPMAKIILDPGSTLTLDSNSVIQAGCRYMWDGVYVNDPSSLVTIHGNSQIYNAINGFVFKDGSPFDIEDSYFVDNYHNIMVINDSLITPDPSSIYQGSIRNTSFQGIQSLYYKPMIGIKTLSGIECDSIYNLTIGDASDQSYKNTFTTMQYGIYAVNSDINVINNEFDKIAYQNSLGSGVKFNFYYEGAIYAMHTATNPITNHLYVGGDALNTNTFNNCITGIHSFNYVSDLDNNIFFDGKLGISLLSPLSGSIVHRNSISQKDQKTLNSYIGISIQNPIQSTIYCVKVDSNTINNQYTGISMIGMYSASYLKGALIENNAINNYYSIYHNSFPTKYYGMDIQNCNKLTVSNNTVNYVPYNILDSTHSTTLRGISIGNNVLGSTIYSNHFNQLGSGIYTVGNLTSTQFECNNFFENYYGLQFEVNSTISDQGMFNVFNPANTWTDKYGTDRAHGTYGINTLTSSFKYYYVTGDYLPIPKNLGLQLTPTPNTNNSINYCIPPSVPDNPYGHITTASEREIAIGPTVRNQLRFDTLKDENTYSSREYAYRMMLDDSTIIIMGDTSDYVYQNFFNTMQASNSAHYINAITAMSIGNIELANTELSLIVDSTRIDKNRITVGTIYLNTWAQGNYTLTDDQINILYDIANYDPATNGDAVYTARVMLNINPDNRDFKFALAPQLPKQEVKSNSVHLYPNPAKETVTITFDQSITSEGVFEIWSIMGNKLLSKTITTSNIEQKVDVKSLASGIYFYVIKVNGDNFSSGKLIILNK